MKKITTILAATATLASLTGAALPYGTLAASATAAGACSLSAADFSRLQAAQTLTDELNLRKSLLQQTINCAVSDAQSLQQTLNAVSMPDKTSATVQSRLSGKIDDAINFYTIELAKLNDAGISATEAIAKEIVAWRTANYDPTVAQINNLILWAQNQSLFQTAQTRLTQTTQVVNFIEAAAANNNLQAKLNNANSSFETAQSENADAETALVQAQPADQTLALIQQSLQSLADTYQKFSDLNTGIQTLLPTQQ